MSKMQETGISEQGKLLCCSRYHTTLKEAIDAQPETSSFKQLMPITPALSSNITTCYTGGTLASQLEMSEGKNRKISTVK